MNQYLSSVIIALITGVISVITLVIQKRSDKVINKIDEQTMFIEREKEIKFKLKQKEKEKESIIHEMMILILDTNLFIVTNPDLDEQNKPRIDEALKSSIELKGRFNNICEDIKDIEKEYEMLLDMTSDLQKELSKFNTSQ